MTENSDALRVADLLFAAITAGRIDEVRSLYADDAVIWHSNDDQEQGPDENVATLRWASSNLRDMRYTEIRRSATKDGFVQQHVLRAVNRRGEEVTAPACIVCQVHEGRITRLDEYLDGAAVERIVAR